ncbi:hypothetical protein [Rhizobium sp. 'Codium 1']|uniref:hypothetical protein n=1 Tax=Rhizobium sp. 'Codium 1' TaxID=2940484 RepID=UPI001E47FEBE|nr:hypothetical protein [Rhizobium sp. 'Codium 1']MCC8931916.1 hypothetical protein [Rhizobium sp. 'Codium 1']
MFFTRIGKVIAHLVFWLSAFRVATCLFVMFGPLSVDEQQAFVRAYIGSGGLEGLGATLDKAAIALAVGVALGVLCEISARTGWSDRA